MENENVLLKKLIVEFFGLHQDELTELDDVVIDACILFAKSKAIKDHLTKNMYTEDEVYLLVLKSCNEVYDQVINKFIGDCGTGMFNIKEWFEENKNK